MFTRLLWSQMAPSTAHSALIIVKFSDNFWGKVHCATNEEPLAQMSSFIYHGHTHAMSPMLPHTMSTTAHPATALWWPTMINNQIQFVIQVAICKLLIWISMLKKSWWSIMINSMLNYTNTILFHKYLGIPFWCILHF